MNSCPVCTSSDLVDFLDIGSVPAQEGTLLPDRGAALAAGTGRVQLCVCRRCGLIFNRAYSSADIAFDVDTTALHYSPTFQAFLDGEIHRLVDHHGIREKTVVEIGCGGGHFLRMVCSAGRNTGYGFDPSLPETVVEQVGDTTVMLIDELFDADSNVPDPDLLIVRSVLQAIEDPVGFLASIRATVGEAAGALFYFEIPNAAWVFGSGRPWNVYYAQFAYYTEAALPGIFAGCGFATVSCEPCFEDGQYLRLEARVGQATTSGHTKPTDELIRTLRGYADWYFAEVGDWRGRLDGARAAGKRVAIWGAGGRGIAFLNAMSSDPDESLSQVAYAVDINPTRQGLFLPSTGQEVLAPEALREDPVDIVLITNGTYEPEIREDVRELGVTCEFMVI